MNDGKESEKQTNGGELPLEELGKSGQGRPEDEEAKPQDVVEEASDESFPASDPPAY